MLSDIFEEDPTKNGRNKTGGKVWDHWRPDNSWFNKCFDNAWINYAKNEGLKGKIHE